MTLKHSFRLLIDGAQVVLTHSGDVDLAVIPTDIHDFVYLALQKCYTHARE